jgi:hypothetical protein
VGLLFLTATVTFAIGSSLIRSYFSSATSSGGTLVIGVLMLGCSALADVAIGFAMRRVLMPHAPLRSQAYFVLRLAECLVVALLTSRLVPRGLSLLGIVGYAALLLGVVCDLIGIADLTTSAGYAFLVPGGLFELVLPVRLILRGFDRV